MSCSASGLKSGRRRFEGRSAMQLRRELAWVMIVVVVLYGLWLSALGAITYGYAYKPEAHSLMMFSRYTQPMFIFPCALIAFVPRRWATIPLWLLSISIALFIYLLTKETFLPEKKLKCIFCPKLYAFYFLFTK